MRYYTRGSTSRLCHQWCTSPQSDLCAHGGYHHHSLHTVSPYKLHTHGGKGGCVYSRTAPPGLHRPTQASSWLLVESTLERKSQTLPVSTRGTSAQLLEVVGTPSLVTVKTELRLPKTRVVALSCTVLFDDSMRAALPNCTFRTLNCCYHRHRSLGRPRCWFQPFQLHFSHPKLLLPPLARASEVLVPTVPTVPTVLGAATLHRATYTCTTSCPRGSTCVVTPYGSNVQVEAC